MAPPGFKIPSGTTPMSLTEAKVEALELFKTLTRTLDDSTDQTEFLKAINKLRILNVCSAG
jgi:hypothetical protein